MIKIETLKDISKIRKENGLPEAYIEVLEKYFKELVISLTGEEVWHTYSLINDGPLIILTQEEEEFKIDEYGIKFNRNKVSTFVPEFCNKLKIPGVPYEIWQIFILCSNDFMIVIYSPVGQFGQEFNEWIEEYLIPEN